MKRFVAAALAMLLGLTAGASAQPQGEPGHLFMQGAAHAITGDTLAFGEWRVFLFGIDSVGRTDFCRIDGIAWQCPVASVRSLDDIVGVAEVRCELLGEPDYLQRYFGTCTVAGEDVAAQQVLAGFAWASPRESIDYLDEERTAKEAKVGFWQGTIF